MRIAVYSHDTDERHHLSRTIDDILPARGLIPKISLFPFPHELLQSAVAEPYDLILLSGHRDESLLRQLCSMTDLILIGDAAMGPVAFDVGAAYFVESPTDRHKLEKAVHHCVERILVKFPHRFGLSRNVRMQSDPLGGM